MTERIITFGEAIREALAEAARDDESVFLMGEGIADPSSFWGTTAGVIDRDERLPHRLVEMPIAENAMVGVAVGAALSGQRPVISLHRVEFALLAIEQIVNNAAKAHYVSNGRHRAPMVIRMVIGRGWGQGPEHSQSLEAVFAHFPGLKVVMPSFAADAKGLLHGAIRDDNPVIFLEHRWLHNVTGHVPEGSYEHPLDGPRVVLPGTDVTIVSSAYMTLEAMQAARALAVVGCSAEVIDLRVLRPLRLDPIVESVRRTGRLLTVDTGFRHLGMGAEIVASVTGDAFDALRAAPRRLGLPDHPTPSSRGLIPGYYPDAIRIVDEVVQLCGLDTRAHAEAHAALDAERGDTPVDVPDPSFRGPF